MPARQTDEKSIIERAFRQERKVSAQLGFRVRAVGIGVIALALSLRVSGAPLVYYSATLAVLIITGWLFYRSTTRSAGLGRWVVPAQALLIGIDMAIVAAALVIPSPGSPEGWPDAMQLRLGNVGFLFVFLAFSALTYSPLLALWAGVAAGAAWLGGVLWVLAQPGSFTLGPADFAEMNVGSIIRALLDPNYVSVIAAAQEAFLLAVVGAVISAAVWRGRRQALRQITATRARTRLARYFSPDVVAELNHLSGDLETSETREAAILFADIFGFTRLAEDMSPEETIDFLREFHHRATSAVFSNGGTLNKFIGDEIMATFGAIHEMDKPGAAAVGAARAIVESVEDWSAERQQRGLSPVKVGVGVHVGPVVVGNIGDERCLELAVLGDVVNTASRLQALTRRHDARIIVSEKALSLARAQDAETEGFGDAQTAFIRGREGQVEILTLA